MRFHLSSNLVYIRNNRKSIKMLNWLKVSNDFLPISKGTTTGRPLLILKRGPQCSYESFQLLLLQMSSSSRRAMRLNALVTQGDSEWEVASAARERSSTWQHSGRRKETGCFTHRPWGDWLGLLVWFLCVKLMHAFSKEYLVCTYLIQSETCQGNGYSVPSLAVVPYCGLHGGKWMSIVETLIAN